MPVATLDYPKAEIRMDVSTQIEAQYRVNACKKEPWTVEFIEGMKGRAVFWDVGANVGSYALLSAALGHNCVAIEPGLANFNAMLKNGGLNATKGRIFAVNVALGATTVKIPYTQSGEPGHGEGGALALEVQQVTIDDLAKTEGIPPPTHLKIDVDGHELGVLAGAERTLRGGPLRAVLCEVKIDLGERISDLMARWGWTRTAIYDTRNGEKIGGVRYEEFTRNGTT